MGKKRVGIVGYGHLGQFLFECVSQSEEFEVAFVWNRTPEKLGSVDDSLICRDLESFESFNADLIVEVAHPVITKKYGPMFLSKSDLFVGSPTALADSSTNQALREAAYSHGMYVGVGAFWGAEDIVKMSENGTLKGLKVTMRKHPSCLNLESPLKEINDSVTLSPVTLFDGPVRDLCPLAPNNVNTMAVAAIAARNLGFDNVQGCLVSDPGLTDFHIVEVDVTGPEMNGRTFTVNTVRKNPSNLGVVTGKGTYNSFYASLKRAGRKGPGVHIC